MRRWADLSLQRKLELLIVAFMIPVLGMVVVLLTTGLQLNQALNERYRVGQFDTYLDQLEIAVLNIETGQRGYQLSGNPGFLEPYNKGLRDTQTALAGLREMGLFPGEVERLEEAVYSFIEEWAKPSVAKVELGRTLTPEEQNALLRDGKVLFDSLRIRFDSLQRATELQFNLIRERSNRATQTLTALPWLLLLLVIVAALGLRLGLSRTVAERLSRLQRATEQIAEGDYGVRVAVHSRDEVGQLATAFNLMAASLERTTHSLEAARTRSELLAALTDALQSATSSQEVARIAIQGLNQLLGASYMFVNELVGDTLVFTGWYGELPPEMGPVLETGVPLAASPEATEVIRSGRPLYDHRFYTGERQPPGQPELGLAIEPIRTPGGKVTGIISAIRPSALGEWTAEERELIARSVAAVGIALERSKNQAELRERTAELERSNRELEQFAYVASHDLQEPLRMVSSYTQLLARRYRGQLDEKADQYIDFAVDGANRMQKLIQDLLSYSRVGTKGREPQPTDAGEVMQEVLRDLEVALRESGARLEVGELPRLQADRSQLAQVFQNLLVNALKFRRPGVTPYIRVCAQPEGAMWKFSVSDNGIGVEPQYHERIFVIFQRLHSKEEYPGTGIGLAICKKIVERHGGRMWLESSPETGSTFYFTWPAAEERV
ncbi:Phytochrome-like protein cph1 [Calidithermus terrae]|uniref:histidine kinase n=1 Tax=Calidithermus terrae TaxID=1408545 RepID=A0A399EWQ9_9DEIN|nr:ATP-binding protein [Calidithermus terrae]RIH88070.1 Phytochrome-like protein cph1 [Calidithermus terrae]